jgi:ATP-dependent protease ClpP protease subunit
VDKIKVEINSPGGDVFDGMAIFNALKSHPATVETCVTGLAASIASVIFMAGDVRQMEEFSQIMLHRAWSFAMGSSTELRKTADQLDRVDGQLISLYNKATNLGADKIENMMEEETWLTSFEAQELGFGEVLSIPESRAQNLFDLSIYKNTPNNLMKYVNEKKLAQVKRDLSEKEKNDEIRNRMKDRLASFV